MNELLLALFAVVGVFAATGVAAVVWGEQVQGWLRSKEAAVKDERQRRA